MPVDALRGQAVELDPRAARRGFLVQRAILFAVRVDPDERRQRHAVPLEDVELLERGDAVAGVRGDRQPGRLVRDRRGSHQLRIHLRERPRVDADLHEARHDPGAVDALLALADPARRELLRCLGERVRRQVLVLVGAVVAGVREDVQARRLGEPPQQPRIAAQIGRRALDQRRAAVRLRLPEERQRPREHLVGVVARRADLRGADEIDEHVLVHQRQPELRGIDRARHRLDDAPPRGRLRPRRSRDRRTHHAEASGKPFPPGRIEPDAHRSSVPIISESASTRCLSQRYFARSRRRRERTRPARRRG